jgi:hypothetical protein
MLKHVCLAAVLLAFSNQILQAAEPPFGCYVRNYDKQHLKIHKGQNITSMSLKLYSGKDVEGFTGAMFADVSVKLRGDNKQTWSEVADCSGKPGAWTCGIECDGGGFTLKENSTGIVLTNSSYFRLAKDGCGENSMMIEATPEHRVFKLKKSQLSACK